MAVLPKPRIEAIQTVTTFKMTDPRVTQTVELGPASSFGACFNTVLYFKRGDEGSDFSGWDTAGWIKDSLGKAFVDEPLLCGRLRRTQEGSKDSLEIVSNDSGCRLVEARIGISIEEFMGSEGREEAETGLVYWKDIDQENPQYCPLFYVQVTNFQCGGYSIGISCSLLLAGPPFITTFLKRWATIHSNLVSKITPTVKKPIFHLHKVSTTDPLSPSALSPSPCRKLARTAIFKADGAVNSNPNWLALRCVEDAEKAVEAELGPRFPLLVREKSGQVKVITIAKDDGSVRAHPGPGDHPCRMRWESFGADQIAFREGKLPTTVSQWIGSPEGFVMVSPCGGEDDEHRACVFATI
ncbi:hypothetical protein SAY86_027496 [Trapa natans]|uniref:Uncharacterized protein n=1 Tax=Trapa natans TaxID=22666 RepID=A0AAN7KLI6_TRANT|nr:hypothetical protein SAY86_027496 [Trapa natans]